MSGDGAPNFRLASLGVWMGRDSAPSPSLSKHSSSLRSCTFVVAIIIDREELVTHISNFTSKTLHLTFNSTCIWPYLYSLHLLEWCRLKYVIRITLIKLLKNISNLAPSFKCTNFAGDRDRLWGEGIWIMSGDRDSMWGEGVWIMSGDRDRLWREGVWIMSILFLYNLGVCH